MVKIRWAKKADCPEILKILRSTPELQGSGMTVDSEYTEEYVLNSVLDAESSCVLVAEEGDKIVGILTAEVFRKKGYSFFTDIAIVGSHRNKGIGDMLYNRYEEILRRKSISTLAGIMRTNNRVMRKFCREHGLRIGEKMYYFEKRLK